MDVAVIPYGPAQPAVTTEIGGSRFALWDSGMGLQPPGYGPILANQQYAVPSVPPNYGDLGMTGMPNADTATAMAAGQSPFSMQQSPLLWVLIALAGGLVAIHLIHWKGE